MKHSTGRPSPLRYLLLLPVVVLGVATILATSPVTSPHASLTVSNVANAVCSPIGGNIVCRFSATVQVNNYKFKNTTATFITTDLLVGQWTPTSAPNLTSLENPSGSVAFEHKGLTCVGPQTTLAVYDGFTDTGTLVASLQLDPPVTLACQ